MTPPFAGSWQVMIHRADPYAIHGDPYFQLAVQPVDPPSDAPPGSLLALRASAHCLPNPLPPLPFPARITFLLGQVTAVTPHP